MPWKALIALCLLASASGAEPDPVRPPDEATRRKIILKAFYEAIETTAQAHASVSYREAMAFVEKGGMEKEILKRIGEIAGVDPKPDDYEIRHVLAGRSAQDLKRGPLRKTYGKLTCLFVCAEAWVPRTDRRHPRKKTWEKKALTDAQRDMIWKRVGQGVRQEALLAHYGRLHGRHMKAESEDCKRCEGGSHDSVNSTGKTGILRKEDLDWWGSTCPRCLGVGIVVAVEFD